VVSCFACLINPYGIKGFVLPIELLTRFTPQNIYHQHIQEFIPFFAQSRFVFHDYLLLVVFVVYSAFTLFTRKLNKPHEYLLPIIFGILAISSIRNIPLFALVAIPIVCRQANDLTARINPYHQPLNKIAWIVLILIPLIVTPRLITNAWYQENNSFFRTGIGPDESHLPIRAAEFLQKNGLDGRILNSIGFGGWLSWTIPQPVFIDGRLEVMQEPIYREITDSWQNLPKLINQYKPQLIVYNYLKYYPWTRQLRWMSDWRLVHADGFTAIFATGDRAATIPTVIPAQTGPSDIPQVNGAFEEWCHGFSQPVDDASINRIHLSMLRDQVYPCTRKKKPGELAVDFYNMANLKYQRGDYQGALADYDTAIILKSDYFKAYNNRGILRASSLKDYYGAIADFDKAIMLNPRYAEAYLGRGTSYFLLKNLQLACKDWHVASSLGSVQASRLIELHCNQQ